MWDYTFYLNDKNAQSDVRFEIFIQYQKHQLRYLPSSHGTSFSDSLNLYFLSKLCGEQHHFRVFNTAVCPRNQSELNKRSAAINCNNTNGYMCFPNEHLTQLQEFCYNLPRIGISKSKIKYFWKSLKSFDFKILWIFHIIW